MAKPQTKKSPAPRGKVKKEGEDIVESGDVKAEQTKNETEELKATEAPDVEEAPKNGDAEKEASSEEEGPEEESEKEAADANEESAGKDEAAEETKQDEQAEKPSTDGKGEEKEKTPRRRRRKGKKQKTAEGENDNGKPKEKKEKVVAGVIFMCNEQTKEECFKHRVFGLPEAKKKTVEKITPGMKLFLFDFDQRLLYGVYEASSKGGENLQPNAFKSSKKSFPFQVRFRIKKDSLPLSEDDFKPAIKDNYYGRSRFNIELVAEQVKSLEQLFRPVGNKAKKNAEKVQKTTTTTKPVKKFQRTAPRSGFTARRDAPYNERRYPLASYVPSRLPAYGVDPGYVAADPYLVPRARLPEVSVDSVYGLGQELDPLYRQRSSAYSDALLRQAGKRPLDDLYLDDRYVLPAPKRSLVQDELLYRSHPYQRAVTYGDSYYTGLPPY